MIVRYVGFVGIEYRKPLFIVKFNGLNFCIGHYKSTTNTICNPIPN